MLLKLLKLTKFKEFVKIITPKLKNKNSDKEKIINFI